MPDSLSLLAVHAHPDDESICTGGTLARYAAEGMRTAIVCCTRGEEGEIHDPAIDAAATRPRLGQIREAELRHAAAELGVESVFLLSYRDSGMEGAPANDNPASFMRADVVAAARELAVIVRMARPQVVVTYDAAGGYGHPDHRMAHRVTLLAFAQAARPGAGGQGWDVSKLYYTTFSLAALQRVNAAMRARGFAPPFCLDNPALGIRQSLAADDIITTRVDVSARREQVRRALRAHRTQIGTDDVLLTLPRDVAADAFAIECYIRAFTRVSAPDRETDLFAGLRR